MSHALTSYYPTSDSLDRLIEEWSINKSAAADLPVTLEQLRSQTRVIVDDTVSPPTSPDDADLELYGEAATQAAEDWTRRVFYERNVTLSRDAFTRTLYLPIDPIQSVTSVEYRDVDGNTQTIAASNYRVDLNKFPGRIAFNSGYSFPSTDDEINAVTVTVTAGYGVAAAVPYAVRAAILLHAATLFEHRESVVVGTTAQDVPMTWERLLWPYRLVSV